jgi:hypothetical protein
MGWSIEALRRELDILRDVIMNGVRVHTRDGGAHPEDATGVLTHLIDRAAMISRRSWHRAAHGPGGMSAEGDVLHVPDIADMPRPG